MKKDTLLYIAALVGCFLIGCCVTLGFRYADSQEIKPMKGGQSWDLTQFSFHMRVPEDAELLDHTQENAALGGNALYAGSAAGKSGTLYLFCYENEEGDRLSDYPDQELVTYYMNAGATSVRTRIIGGRRFICYRAVVLTEEGEQTWDTYETWDETLQISFETQMQPDVVLPILATIKFESK